MMQDDDGGVISRAALVVGVLGAVGIMFSPLTPWPSHIAICGGTAAIVAVVIIVTELFRWSGMRDRKHRDR